MSTGVIELVFSRLLCSFVALSGELLSFELFVKLFDKVLESMGNIGLECSIQKRIRSIISHVLQNDQQNLVKGGARDLKNVLLVSYIIVQIRKLHAYQKSYFSSSELESKNLHLSS